ncbi:MAG: MerR family transcriptional regulator [Alphaproteobacteria bacterium]|nr:MerR family transcriptional regulator [Alphaproteobacteria bacterium]
MDAGKSANAFRTISEVAEDLGVPQHVLRFWETKFPAISPLKRGGNRRYYRPEDVALLRAINRLLYTEGYTIRGVQKLIKEQGAKAVANGETAPAVSVAPEPAATPAMAAVSAGLTSMQRAELRAIRDMLERALAA